MSPRDVRRFAPYLAAVACVAALGAARPLASQTPRVVVVGGDRTAITLSTVLGISDDSIRSLIETHHPDALLNDGDAHSVTLVIDADGRYVSGKVTKATVVAATGDASNGLRTFVVGDSAVGVGNGLVVVRRRDSAGEPVRVSVATSDEPPVTVLFSKSGDGDPANGVFGSGYPKDDVAMVGLKRFAAGQFGSMPLVVTVVRLK
ncbi:MAG: hypothetical protein ABJF01_07475 [bacterium]